MGKEQNILIVGAGLSGSVVARCLANYGYRITIIDRRNHIGGNCYDYVENNVRIHKYGPHIFHTSSDKIFNWILKFTDWTHYQHKVTALYNNQFYTFPPNNVTTQLFGEQKTFNIFYELYTKKMWGDVNISSSVFKRVRVTENSNLYFPNDPHQGFPKNGYTNLFENILDHQNINLILNTQFDKHLEKNFYHTFNSMSIDSYYDYCFGELDYRSIKFHHVNKINHEMPTPVVNYTQLDRYTRVVNWSAFPNHGNGQHFTLEEPCDHKDNCYESYYPIQDVNKRNQNLYSMYKNIFNNRTTFIGRCGLYRYLDMDQTISSSLRTVEKFIKNEKLI